MKRVIILLFLLVVSTTNTSCCRGLRCWGNRGTPCQPQCVQPQYVQPQYVQPQPQFVQPQAFPTTQMAPCPPQAAPVIVCPPVECVPTTVCPPTNVCSPDPCLSMDYGSSSVLQPVPAQPQPSAGTFDGVYFPGGASSSLVQYGRPISDVAISPLQPIQTMSPSR